MADPLDGRSGEAWPGKAANGSHGTIAIARRGSVTVAVPSREAVLNLVSRREGARNAFYAGE